jgi:Flp pilus assembly protein TadG
MLGLRLPRLRLAIGSEGSQLVEFAVALPLLVVFVVAIFDFGQAFNLKLKLSGAAREGARLGSSVPTSDLTTPGTPASVEAVRYIVDAYLIKGGVNDCGLAALAGGTPSPTLTWTYTASGGGCPAGFPLTLTVNRAYAFKTTVNTVDVDVICTQVTITYPYVWHFNNVIQLLSPGATYAGTTLIPTDATAPNMD